MCAYLCGCNVRVYVFMCSVHPYVFFFNSVEHRLKLKYFKKNLFLNQFSFFVSHLRNIFPKHGLMKSSELGPKRDFKKLKMFDEILGTSELGRIPFNNPLPSQMRTIMHTTYTLILIFERSPWLFRDNLKDLN